MAAEIKKWIITSSLRQRVETLRREIEADEAAFERKPQLCPIHSRLGVFVRREGAYTRGYAIFKCLKGHEFKFG